MENLSIKINDAISFDKILQGSLPDDGHPVIITKDNATVGGQPAVMITFSVQLPDGTMAVAQTVTTVKLMMTALNALEARYGQMVEAEKEE